MEIQPFMLKIIELIKKNIFVILLLLLTSFTFFRMLKTGMFSTQDFHLFRLYEFDRCIESMQIPCRWAPDAGLGYGEPLFNFYGQGVYWVGELFHLLGLSLINSVKGVFVLSLAGSALSMFYLAKKIWKDNLSAFVSGLLYVFAPYRAVDVWVRGALPEAFGFVLLPLILLSIESGSLIWFSVLLSFLILTHNLSVLMFLPIIVIWVIYRKFWKALYGGVLSFLLTSFYILPVVFESKFIDIKSTIQGYFDFHNHFATSTELFVSNFWGYGASVWGPKDDLSFAVGYLQWILPLGIFIFLIFRKEVKKYSQFLILFFLGWFYLFLTHNKSTLVWEVIPFLSYVQFPWRFLGAIVFCFSLASGILMTLLKKQRPWLLLLITIFAIFLNVNFFREDIWYSVDDNYYLTGVEWDRQRTASIGDFWPNFGHEIPQKPSDGKYINYFPGWVSQSPPANGLILSEGAKFTDTPIRTIGNIISLASIVILSVCVFKKKWIKRI